MVGPGTGLAPFRAFVQERAAAAARGVVLGEAVLYFGCRSADADYIYRDELEAAVGRSGTNAPLSALHVAFSRPPPGGPPRAHVQDIMATHAATLRDLLVARSGYLYVCGDAKNMARDVHRMLLERVLGGPGGMTAAAAEAAAQRMHDEGRLQRDVW
jgi:NADPH-ferrihemoprotein reductase